MLRYLTAGALALTSLGAAPAADAATCGTLPAVVQGNPNVQPLQRGAAYLFHTSHGWSLRVTHASRTKAVVTGTIRTTNGVSNLHLYHLEKGDAVATGNGGRLVSFRFSNVGHLDGFDFTAECSPRLALDVHVNGKQVPTTQVYLGKNRVHPTSVPVVIERH